MDIEDTTTKFDEYSMFKSVPNLIKLLIRNNAVNAKDFLKARVCDDDIELLSVFGQYTIEALIVYVLSMLFSPVQDPSNPAIRVSTLVEQLESSVRTQAALLKHRKCYQPFSKINQNKEENISRNERSKRSKLEQKYPFGTGLVEFMEERGVIKLSNDLSGTVRVAKKKNGSYYLPSYLYAICIFDMSLLPIKLNLPMVCKPVDWKSACPTGKKPRHLSDLSGGYLSEPTGALYDRYRLLSSGDINHFFIDISHNYEKLCSVMNKLQSQAFQINSKWLNILLKDEKEFVESGYLMPRFLASLNINDVSMLLREFHIQDEVINKLFSFSELLQILYKNIQRSRYESLILKLAKAYEGYKFYLPAFLDFRGRIYRCGILRSGLRNGD
ncbi:hypothetical protein CDL12_15666 [Handroanthus impetiginosus]|uniref:Uncharacterized protein n=1 Tax=Handroanthus impetiginosus TaxID=429701 RepID=A0A2G9H2I2_9LAMI|nr:hypothetical protein CDL12_15666 [Handroanthus impetiginosus]